MLIDAVQYRQSALEEYQCTLPWTAYDGPQGVRTVLIKQVSVMYVKFIFLRLVMVCVCVCV